MMKIKIIEVIENYSITDLEIRSDVINEMICTGRFHGELIHENGYGSKYTVAKCLVTGDPLDLLDICKEAQRSEFGFTLYPIDMFELA